MKFILTMLNVVASVSLAIANILLVYMIVQSPMWSRDIVDAIFLTFLAVVTIGSLDVFVVFFIIHESKEE